MRLPIDFSSIYLKLAAIALLAGLSAWSGYAIRDLSADSQIATLNAKHAAERERLATVKAASAEKARAADAKTAFRVQETIDADTLNRQAVAAAARRADAATRSLRDELATARAAFDALAADHTQAAEGCRATAQAAAVLTDLLGRCSEERRGLAEYADQASTAGAACIGTYRALTDP